MYYTREYLNRAHREIDTIFRVLFPEHGMAVREEQIMLCHKMLDNLLGRNIALCDAGVGIGKTYYLKAVNWFADYVYALRNALFHEIISPLDEEWQGIFKSAYLLLKQVSDICISCISQIEGFSQTQENAIFEYAEKHKSEYFDSLAEYVELLDFPKMVLSDWKIEKGKIILKGWFSARLKLQQGDAKDIENGTGFIREEEKGFDFSATLGDDFKIAKDKETQKECVEIKLQGT